MGEEGREGGKGREGKREKGRKERDSEQVKREIKRKERSLMIHTELAFRKHHQGTGQMPQWVRALVVQT